MGIGAGFDFDLLVVWPLLLPTNRDAGIMEWCISSSSGSTSSSNLSAALSACSALALSASSTTGWPFPMSVRESEDNAFDTPAAGLESLDLGENDSTCFFVCGVIGGYISKGAENDIRLTESPSESLSPSGTGTACASNKDSSSPLISCIDNRECRVGRGTGVSRELPLVRGVGVETEEGGDAGRAV